MKQQIQKIGLNDSSNQSYGASGPTFPFKMLIPAVTSHLLWFHLTLSLDVYREINVAVRAWSSASSLAQAF